MKSTIVCRRTKLNIRAVTKHFVAALFLFMASEAMDRSSSVQAAVYQEPAKEESQPPAKDAPSEEVKATEAKPSTETKDEAKPKTELPPTELPAASEGDKAAEPTSTDEKTQVLLDQASQAFQAGDMAACEVALVDAKMLDAGLESPAVIIARMFLASGRAAEAIQRLDVYLAKNDDPDGYLRLGEIALSSGRFTDAFLLLERTRGLAKDQKWSDLRRKSFTRELTRLRGATAQSRERYDDAIKIYTDHLNNDPELYAAMWELGKVEVIKGKEDEGLARMKTACEKDENLMQPELALALIKSNQREDEAAEKWFTASTESSKAKLVSWTEFARWLLLRDRAAEALTLLDRVPAADRETRDVKFLRGLSLRFVGELDKAEPIFSELSQAQPNDVESADQLALILIERTDEGKRARAQQIAEANLRKAPNAETALATAGWIHFRLGSTDIADRLLTEAATNRRITPQTAYYIAKLLEDRGRDEDSLALYQNAVKEPGIFVQRREVEKQLKSKQK